MVLKQQPNIWQKLPALDLDSDQATLVESKTNAFASAAESVAAKENAAPESEMPESIEIPETVEIPETIEGMPEEDSAH